MDTRLTSDLTDAAFEQVENTAKTVKRDLLKGIPAAVKQQISGQARQRDTDSEQVEARKKAQSDKIDPVTGKPIPSKKALTQLTAKVAQLSQARIKKVREELAKQRLRTVSSDQSKSKIPGVGPEVPVEKAKPSEDIVAKTLRRSQSTGEIKGGGYG